MTVEKAWNYIHDEGIEERIQSPGDYWSACLKFWRQVKGKDQIDLSTAQVKWLDSIQAALTK